jgi:hypothetical protein
VLMMENHSYDNHLGMLGRAGADGFALGSNGLPLAVNPYAAGQAAARHPPWRDGLQQQRARHDPAPGLDLPSLPHPPHPSRPGLP